MSLYFLDTNTLTLLQRRHPRLVANLSAHIGDEIAVTSVNVEEALGGWYAMLRKARSNIDQAKAAALALELGATVVSNNLRDFSRVPGLSVEDWTV